MTNQITQEDNPEKETVKESQFSLIPQCIDEFNQDGSINAAYRPVLDLEEKLRDPEIKNMAITGPYGAGKSSVLCSLKKRVQGNYTFLDISLASLASGEQDSTKLASSMSIEHKNASDTDDNKEQNENDKVNGTPNQENNKDSNKNTRDKTPLSSQDEDRINRLIEYSILQQLMYREKYSVLPNSRFKRIEEACCISEFRIGVFLLKSLLTLVCLSIIFYPHFIHIPELASVFVCSQPVRIFWILVSLLWVIVYIREIVARLVPIINKTRINKLSIKDAEIDISEKTSIFNKHLDEIIYFFQSTKYNVVLLEDLDRFNTHSIFLKLRELNMMLNASAQINRKITFVYAVKDDIFINCDRTKFFDYITTVIPVINPSNACDKLLHALRDNGVEEDEVSDKACMELGFYIDDMRILKNIVNEYLQYRSKVYEKIDHEKLLGMMLYKNYYPSDFSALHNREGIVYTALTNISLYIKEVTLELEEKIKTEEKVLQDEIGTYRKLGREELRAVYVMQYVRNIPRLETFTTPNGSVDYSFEELIKSEDKFKMLQNGEINHGKTRRGVEELPYSFKAIERQIDRNNTYNSKKQETTPAVKNLQDEIKKLKKEKEEITQFNLSTLLQIHDVKSFDTYMNEKDGERKIIPYLLQEGYIDEGYYDYISYFYEGTLSPGDKDFIVTLRIRQKKEYEYKLDKIANIIPQIPDVAFWSGGVLNFSLIDFLMKDYSTYHELIKRICKSVVDTKDVQFLETYYNHFTRSARFIEGVLALWTDFVEEIDNESVEPDVAITIILRHLPIDMVEHCNRDTFKNLLVQRYALIAERSEVFNIDLVKHMIETFEIKFRDLSLDSAKLLDFVISKEAYNINPANIELIVSTFGNETKLLYQTLSYTAITQSGHTDFISTMNNNLEAFITCFPDTCIYENEEALIHIASSDVSDEIKKQYLMKQENKIVDISRVDNSLYDLMYSLNLVEATWGNVWTYLSHFSNESYSQQEASNKILFEYITMNAQQLATQQVGESGLEHEQQLELFNAIIATNTLDNQSYSLLVPVFPFHMEKGDISELDNEKVLCLIENDKLIYYYYYKQIKKNFPELQLKFVLKNIVHFWESINRYRPDASLVLQLFQSNEVEEADKRAHVPEILHLCEYSKELTDVVCELLTKTNIDGLSWDNICSLAFQCTQHPLKLDLLVKGLLKFEYNEWDTKRALNLLGGKYAKIGDDNDEVVIINKTPNDLRLVSFLESHQFINGFVEHKDVIRVFSKAM